MLETWNLGQKEKKKKSFLKVIGVNAPNLFLLLTISWSECQVFVGNSIFKITVEYYVYDLWMEIFEISVGWRMEYRYQKAPIKDW